MLNQDAVRIQNSGYVSLDDYKEYIISYENPYEATGTPGESDDETDDAGESDGEEAGETSGEPADE
jgi:hypothetical protein